MKMPSCSQLMHLNTLVTPGGVHNFNPFTADFCLTDLVVDPGAEGLKAVCNIFLVTPAVSSEWLFALFVDDHGQRVSLNSGIVCPKGSYLAATGVAAYTANLRVLLTGYTC